MLRINAILLTSALAVCGCEIDPNAPEQGADEIIARITPTRQLKVDRMVTGPEFSQYKMRHQGRAVHYAGLRTQRDLVDQILFQLYRSEHLRAADTKEDVKEARVALRRGIQPTASPRGFVNHGRSMRRRAYGTPFFQRLVANRTAAVADIGAAVVRPQVPHAERVELLRLLNALVKDRSDPAASNAAKATFLAYATATYDRTVEDYTPHLAFAYYGRLETDARTREANGLRFTRASHAAIPPHLARRMYSSTAFTQVRAATRSLGVSR